MQLNETLNYNKHSIKSLWILNKPIAVLVLSISAELFIERFREIELPTHVHCYGIVFIQAAIH